MKEPVLIKAQKENKLKKGNRALVNCRTSNSLTCVTEVPGGEEREIR